MKKLGRNTLAVGLSTLLVTSAVSLSANAAEDFDYKSYAEARYIAAGGVLGENLVDPLAAVLEGEEDSAVNGGAAFARVDTAAGSDETAGPAFPEGPLDPLAQLTGPIGDLLGSQGAAAVSTYAFAQRDASDAAAGLLADGGGLVDLDTIPDESKPQGLSLSLTGEGAPLEAVNAVANATLELPVASSTVTLAENAPTAPIRDYQVAGGSIEAEVAALATVLDALGGLDDLGDLAIEVPVVGGVTLVGTQDLLDSITSLSSGGVTVDLNAATVTLDIEQLVEAVTGTSINDLPANSRLLPIVTQGVSAALPQLVTQLNEQVLTAVQGLDVEVALLGTPPTTIPLSELTGALLAPLQEAINTIVTSALEPLSTALFADALSPLLTALADAGVIDLKVNVWETDDRGGYRGLVSDRTGTEGVYSVSGLRLSLLDAAGDGGLADIYLGNSLVGPNSRTPIVEQDQVAAVDDGGDQADGTIADAQADAQADAIADADAQADADVTTSLPNAGAPNLLPFWLLGLGLVAFGAAVLVNERRRALI